MDGVCGKAISFLSRVQGNRKVEGEVFSQKKRLRWRRPPMVLTISEEELLQMKTVVLDKDRDEALSLIKSFVARLEQQGHRGLKSHLDQ
jgi:hypothetical protein